MSYPVYGRALAQHHLRLLVDTHHGPSIVGVRLEPLNGAWQGEQGRRSRSTERGQREGGRWVRQGSSLVVLDVPPSRAERRPEATGGENELENESYTSRPPSALGAAAARIALEEWKRWGQGQIKEGSSSIRPVLEDYWRTGIGQLPTGSSWWSSTPWSAAFISWVMRKAGAGSAFEYSAAHTDYVAAAKRNRAVNSASPFKLYRISEMAPRVGDIVCQERSSSGVTYDNVDQGFRSSHCDIVTEVRPGNISIVGGNVSQSVSMKSVKTDGNGRINVAGFYAIIRVDGASGAVLPEPAPKAGSDPAIEALQLLEPARSAAYAIKARHPWVVFTSGRRDPASQASAMAGNVITNRRWIEQTYAKNSVSAEAQAWVNSHPEARTREAISAGLLQVFQRFTPAELGRLSYHLSALAFDIRPVPSQLPALSATVRAQPRLKEFLTREGGKEIWHVAFA